MDVNEFETFKSFTTLNKVLLFLINSYIFCLTLSGLNPIAAYALTNKPIRPNVAVVVIHNAWATFTSKTLNLCFEVRRCANNIHEKKNFASTKRPKIH